MDCASVSGSSISTRCWHLPPVLSDVNHAIVVSGAVTGMSQPQTEILSAEQEISASARTPYTIHSTVRNCSCHHLCYKCSRVRIPTPMIPSKQPRLAD